MCPPLEVERKLNVKDQRLPHMLKEFIGSDKVWTELRSADKFLDKVAYRDTWAACCKGHLPQGRIQPVFQGGGGIFLKGAKNNF